MSGRAWTPGPWEANHNDIYWTIDSGLDGQIGDACASNYIYRDGIRLADVEAKSIAAANARLIAAAPELFEALNSLAGSVGGLEIAEEAIRAAIGNTNWSVLQTHLDAARAALSKATDDGRQT